MKKIIALLLVAMLAFTFVACSGLTTQDPDADPDANVEDSPSDENNEGAEDQDEDEADEEGSKGEVTFTEMVAVDNDQCSIKITGIDSESFWGYSLNVQLENKSADKTYMFSVDSAAVNGVACDPLFATEVAAGKKANDSITFTEDDLEENGIVDYTDIELSFRVYDSDDWSADEVAGETVNVYPYGEENAEKFVREAKDSDNVIIETEDVTVTVLGYEVDDLWGYSAKLFIENKTDKELMFTVDEVSVNGFMIDPLYATTVGAGKCAFDSISWSDSSFEDNAITEVEEIEFLFRAYDSDDWFADDIVNETITLNP